MSTTCQPHQESCLARSTFVRAVAVGMDRRTDRAAPQLGKGAKVNFLRGLGWGYWLCLRYYSYSKAQVVLLSFLAFFS
jgi:hypothetical protein